MWDSKMMQQTKFIILILMFSISSASASEMNTDKQKLIAKYYEEMKRACSDLPELLFTPPCGSPRSSLERAACENRYIEVTAEMLTRRYGAPSVSQLSLYNVSQQTNWLIISRGWLDLAKKASGSRELSDSAIWLLAVPFSFVTGKYKDDGYFFVRGGIANLSVYGAAGAIFEVQKSNIPGHLIPAYKKFLQAFYTGNSVVMFRMLNDFKKTLRSLSPIHSNTCKNFKPISN